LLLAFLLVEIFLVALQGHVFLGRRRRSENDYEFQEEVGGGKN
jgi:hypothetical protein